MDDIKNASPLQKGGAYESLSALFDERSFTELLSGVGNEKGQAGVVCGYGAVNNALVFAFAQEPSRENGALGAKEAEKIDALCKTAEKSGAPVIGIFDGAGARITEGVGALAAYGKLLAAISSLSGKVPQIAVIKGVCSGMSAIAASTFDFVIASESAQFYINPPTVQRAEGVRDAGSIANASASGAVDIVCPDADAAIAKARELVGILPQNNAQSRAYYECADDPERATDGVSAAKDGRAVIEEIVDSGSFIELRRGVAPDAIVGIAALGEVTTGIVAGVTGKALTPEGARKIASFISFLDAYSIPLLTISDGAGIDRSASSENGALASALARLSGAYSSSTNAKVTLVTGKVGGAFFTLLGSKAVGADLVYALSGAQISVMDPAAAVQFLYGDEIKASDDPAAKRAELTEKYIKENASADFAAREGIIDGVLEDSLVRAKLISGFNMLWAKAEGDICRRHAKLPF